MSSLLIYLSLLCRLTKHHRGNDEGDVLAVRRESVLVKPEGRRARVDAEEKKMVNCQTTEIPFHFGIIHLHQVGHKGKAKLWKEKVFGKDRNRNYD